MGVPLNDPFYIIGLIGFPPKKTSICGNPIWLKHVDHSTMVNFSSLAWHIRSGAWLDLVPSNWNNSYRVGLNCLPKCSLYMFVPQFATSGPSNPQWFWHTHRTEAFNCTFLGILECKVPQELVGGKPESWRINPQLFKHCQSMLKTEKSCVFCCFTEPCCSGYSQMLMRKMVPIIVLTGSLGCLTVSPDYAG